MRWTTTIPHPPTYAVDMQLPHAPASLSGRHATYAVWLVYGLLLLCLGLIFKPFFPLDRGWLGHDYSLMLPNWLDGHIWFSTNGLSTPWFTPSFCAGQPFFPDPQSAFYSFPQLLAILAGPINAAYLLLCLSASLMFWGGYLLARKVFLTGPLAAVLVGGLLMFNGFLPHRIIIGHVGFHGLALVPWLALLLLLPIRSRLDQAGISVLAGVVLAYWVHSGLSTLMLAGGLAVFVIGLLHCMNAGDLRQFMARGLIASVVGLALSASKLMATFSFLALFPRTFYPLPGAPSWHEAAGMTVAALFLESQQAYQIGKASMTNLQATQSPHEWAFNFGMASAVLLVCLMVDRIRRATTAFRLPGWRQFLLGSALLLSLAVPLALNYFDPRWNAFLKTLPIVNSASTLVRWLVVYITIFAVGMGLLLQRATWKRWKSLAVAACLTATVAQSALEGREFYSWQGYDPRSVVIAEKKLRDGTFAAGIRELGSRADMQTETGILQVTSNNLLAAGKSALFCYNPVFGYSLEKFSAEGLTTGPVLAEHNGFLNLKNPACYVYPKENNCKPGDLFRADQREEAQKFASYKPFAFNFSARQEMANRLSYIAWVSFGLLMLGWLAATLWRWRTAPRQSRQPNHVA